MKAREEKELVTCGLTGCRGGEACQVEERASAKALRWECVLSDRRQACGRQREEDPAGPPGPPCEDIHSVKGSTEGLKPRPKIGRDLAKVPEG